MFYREAGQFKTTYQADHAVFPILQDRIGLALILFGAFVLIPLASSDFFLSVVMIPLLILALASIGLNILTGYTARPAGIQLVFYVATLIVIGSLMRLFRHDPDASRRRGPSAQSR